MYISRVTGLYLWQGREGKCPLLSGTATFFNIFLQIQRNCCYYTNKKNNLYIRVYIHILYFNLFENYFVIILLYYFKFYYVFANILYGLRWVFQSDFFSKVLDKSRAINRRYSLTRCNSTVLYHIRLKSFFS